MLPYRPINKYASEQRDIFSGGRRNCRAEILALRDVYLMTCKLRLGLFRLRQRLCVHAKSTIQLRLHSYGVMTGHTN
jgi:hypothetical protein